MKSSLNAAAFFYDYKDKQVLGAFEDLIFGSLGGLVNVPESEITGFEASLEWYPTNNFRVVGSLLHLDTEITGEFRSFDRFSAGINAGTKNFQGQELPAVPDLYANFDFEYTWQLNNGNTALLVQMLAIEVIRKLFSTINVMSQVFHVQAKLLKHINQVIQI